MKAPETITSGLAITKGLSAEAAAIADIVREGDMPHELNPGDVVSIIVPAGCSREEFDGEYLLDQPTRKRGEVKLHTPGSLAEFINRHKSETATTVYANKDGHRFVAVLNDARGEESLSGDDEGAEWADHRATLTMRLTPEWKFWAEHDGQLMGQEEFATLIEDGQSEVREPDAATLLELAMTFVAKTDVKFRSAIVLQSGQRQLNYEEDTTAGAGRDGKLVIPDEFLLGLAPFEGSDPYALRARLRYRLGNGKLAIGYQLIRPHEVLDDAFGGALAAIKEATDVPCFMGEPPTGAAR